MRWWKRAQRSLGVPVLVLAVVVAPLATASSAAADVTKSSQLAPNRVSSGRTAFYSATWTNGLNATLTNPVVTINLPSGWAVASATPPVCTPAGASGPAVLSCPQANIKAGATVTQQLLLTISASGTLKDTSLTAKEASNDQNKSHTDTFLVPDQSPTVLDATADAAGGCIKNGDQPLGTRGGLSTTNPIITTAALTGSSGVSPCVPVTVDEKPAKSPIEACGPGATCTTDIATTDYVALDNQSPPSSPVQLTFTVLATNKNLTWYKSSPGKTTAPVPDCIGATELPAPVDGTTINDCVNSRSKLSSTSVRLGVLWQPGTDPSWRGT